MGYKLSHTFAGLTEQDSIDQVINQSNNLTRFLRGFSSRIEPLFKNDDLSEAGLTAYLDIEIEDARKMNLEAWCIAEPQSTLGDHYQQYTSLCETVEQAVGISMKKAELHVDAISNDYYVLIDMDFSPELPIAAACKYLEKEFKGKDLIDTRQMRVLKSFKDGEDTFTFLLHLRKPAMPRYMDMVATVQEMIDAHDKAIDDYFTQDIFVKDPNKPSN